jgi:predicted exporter
MRFLPAKRLPRLTIYLVVTLGYAAVLWYWVFPWLDRTFINRPALG